MEDLSTNVIPQKVWRSVRVSYPCPLTIPHPLSLSDMSDDPSGWSLTESDPQVFSQLLKDLGVKGLQVVSRQTGALDADSRTTSSRLTRAACPR